MTHCFIINPASGKSNTKEGLEEKIRDACESAGVHYDVYYTKGRLDAIKYIVSFCREHTEEEICFYACGGDGTLCEVVNGVMSLEGREGVSIGVVPVGTGNDFVRNFAPKERFLDMGAQIGGERVKIDVIKCNEHYAINMINIGFDCQVVVKTNEYKKKKYIPSKMAYICGLIATLVKKPGVNMTVSVDGEQAKRRELLLTTFANGRFCGGGFYSNPLSNLKDGMIDAIMVKDVSRFKFVRMVGNYKNGTHLDGKLDDIISHLKANEFDLEFDGATNVSVDGEIVSMDGIKISCVHDALSFVVPMGISGLPFKTQKEAATV